MPASSILMWSDASPSQRLLILAGAICVLMVLVFLLSRWNRARVMRIGAVEPQSRAQDERTALLEAIKEAATEPNMRISLRGFWRGRRLNRRQRYVLLRPLIERKILHFPPATGLDKLLQEVSYYVLSWPPGEVVLNTRDWTRIATDNSGRMPRIIVEGIYGGVNQIGGTGNAQSIGAKPAVNER